MWARRPPRSGSRPTTPAVVEVLGREAQHVPGARASLRARRDRGPRAGLDQPVRGPPRRRSGLAAATTDGPRPTIHMREGERQARLVFGSCRVGAPREPALHALADRGSGRASGSTRSGRTRGGFRQAKRRGRTACSCSATRSTPTRCRRRPPRSSRRAAARRRAAGRSGRRLRGVHAALPRVVVRPGHPLAARDGAVDDDLRRPRSERRLEHLASPGSSEMRALPWWDERVTSAFMAYWLYQHLGNLSPPELAEEAMFAQVQRRRGRRAAPSNVRAHVRSRVGREPVGVLPRLRTLAPARDRLACCARARRRHRDMVDADEWDWIVDHARGSFDHLIIATTLPAYAPHGIHHLEAWNEAVCDGRWGSLAARLGERLRRAVDLEHWAAFQRSFEQLVDLLRAVSRGARRRAARDDHRPERGRPHDVRRARSISAPNAGSSRVYQLVCSPFRNPLSPSQRRIGQGDRVARALRESSRCSPALPVFNGRPQAGATSPAGRSTTRSASSCSMRRRRRVDVLPGDARATRRAAGLEPQLAARSSAQIHRRARGEAERRAGE